MQIIKSFQSIERHGERFKKNSLTVPNQALSIRDILKKYSGNINLAVSQNVIYEDEPNIDRPNPLRNTPDPLTTMLDMQSEIDSIQDAYKQQKNQAEQNQAKIETISA